MASLSTLGAFATTRSITDFVLDLEPFPLPLTFCCRRQSLLRGSTFSPDRARRLNRGTSVCIASITVWQWLVSGASVKESLTSSLRYLYGDFPDQLLCEHAEGRLET